jgi:hypothetical protein
MKGKFTINGKVWDNHIMDDAVKKVMRILADVNEDDINLLYISVGTSADDPDDKTKTALEAEVGSKYAVGSFSVNAVYPFDLELSATIPDDEIDRPETVKELGIWFGPVGSETLFARAVDDTGVLLGVGQAVPVDYDLVLV